MTRGLCDANLTKSCQAVSLAAISGDSLSVNDFLASSVFRAGVVPLASAATIAIGKWTTRRDDATEKIWEVFAMGPDLLMAALIAIPAFITEKATALAAAPANARTLGTVESSGWVFLIVFCITLLGLNFERSVAKRAREADGRLKPLVLGVLVPMLFGSLAVAATFGLAK